MGEGKILKDERYLGWVSGINWWELPRSGLLEHVAQADRQNVSGSCKHLSAAA